VIYFFIARGASLSLRLEIERLLFLIVGNFVLNLSGRY
ncbi:unnamed protein product, partial [Acidithrix sp. C25]